MSQYKPWKKGVPLHQRHPFFYLKGVHALQNQKVAFCLMAGGQGTRLGCSGPKGLVQPGLLIPRCLFQIQSQRIQECCRKLNVPLPPWLIMTSNATHDETISAFDENHQWGYHKEKVSFFKQGNLPSLNQNGEPLSLNGKLVENPDGSGGVIPALHRSGLATFLKENHYEMIFIYNVDNLLVALCDPAYIGFHIEEKLDASAKAILKARPDEAVGVFAENPDGKPCVLEYTDTPKELLASFEMGNAGIYAFSVDFVMRMKDEKLEKHRSWKKIPRDGDLNPEKPNGWKEETFIFDWYRFTDKFAWWEISRENEFAPLKNADPNPIDSPASARRLWNQKWSNQLKEIGIHLSNDVNIDVSPEAEFWTTKKWEKWAQENQNILSQKNIIIQ